MREITFEFYFSIYSDTSYDFKTLNEILDFGPTKTWQIDTLSPKKLYSETSGWQLISQEIDSYIFSEAFQLFFKKSLFKIDRIKSVIIRDKLSCSLDVVIKIYSGFTMPGISVDSAMMEMLVSIGCDIDFDIYDFRQVDKK